MTLSPHRPTMMDPLVERVPDEANGESRPGPLRGARSNGPSTHVKRETHRWARLIHVYTSMIALLVVLFFAVTGLTLNHPEWTFGSDVRFPPAAAIDGFRVGR